MHYYCWKQPHPATSAAAAQRSVRAAQLTPGRGGFIFFFIFSPPGCPFARDVFPHELRQLAETNLQERKKK